jgi:hypothetical protein
VHKDIIMLGPTSEKSHHLNTTILRTKLPVQKLGRKPIPVAAYGLRMHTEWFYVPNVNGQYICLSDCHSGWETFGISWNR